MFLEARKYLYSVMLPLYLTENFIFSTQQTKYLKITKIIKIVKIQTENNQL